MLEDEINIFWGYSVTSQNAVLTSDIAFCISHTTGHILITDIKEDIETPILQNLLNRFN